jgi:stage II sporulation protein D
VFSLFHPRDLIVAPAQGTALSVRIGERAATVQSNARVRVFRESNRRIEARFSAGGGDLRGTSLVARAADGAAGAHFWLEAPGKLRRLYSGTLEIRPRGAALEAILTMPLETAVASVVQAESPPGAGLEALKAQAVAARSFLVARQAGHADFDFCDTTHCQFLRSPPAPGSAADKAAKATAGLVLTWHDDAAAQDRTLAAMYARSCGGRTRSLREIGAAGSGYQYYAVRCVYCSRHPELWRREGRAAPRSERDRLTFNRIHGWGALPSLPADSGEDGKGTVRGRGIGHGVGLCQLGAADMARRGAGFAQILAHYYPNTRVSTVASQ